MIAPTVVGGQEIPLQFRVQNSGTRSIDGCIGLARNVRIVPDNDTDGNEPIEISSTSLDRPGCRQRFRLAPGARFEWSETTRVPGFLLGPVGLEIDVQMVDPRRCHSDLGCPDVMLTAGALTVIR